MTEIAINKIVPLVLIFILGALLRRGRLFKRADGDILLRVVFYLASPALSVIALSELPLDHRYIFLPVSAAIIVGLMFLLSFPAAHSLKLSKRETGVFLVGTMIMNTNFTLPFLVAIYGNNGLALLTIFDFGSVILIYTFIYMVAVWYGKNDNHLPSMIKKIFLAPPLWAIIIGVALNITDTAIPAPALNLLTLLGNMTVPLIMLSLGIYFELKINHIKPTLIAMGVRSILGGLCGWGLATLFGLEGLPFAIVVVSASAPIGYTTLIYASLEDLDKDFAASMVSLSIFMGFISIPLMLLLTHL